MHPQKLIDTMVEFEKDLAAFYQKLENVDRLKKLKKTLQFMHKHSDIHAELIRNFRSDTSVPTLNVDPLHALHTRIKSALSEQILATKDLGDIYERLAEAEALISRIYTGISEHYQKTADIYSKLCQNFKNLADDEMQHHQHIQEDLELFKKMDGL